MPCVVVDVNIDCNFGFWTVFTFQTITKWPDKPWAGTQTCMPGLMFGLSGQLCTWWPPLGSVKGSRGSTDSLQANKTGQTGPRTRKKLKKTVQPCVEAKKQQKPVTTDRLVGVYAEGGTAEAGAGSGAARPAGSGARCPAGGRRRGAGAAAAEAGMHSA